MARKSAVSLWIWGAVSIAIWGLAAPSQAQEPSASSVLRRFRGEWGCSFESPASSFGALRGIEQVQLDRSGNVAGTETVAGADPFVELQTTFSGRLSAQENGSLKGVLNLHVLVPPGIPDQAFDIQCIGMSTQGDRYTEMRCLDVFNQADGSKVIGVLTCKAR